MSDATFHKAPVSFGDIFEAVRISRYQDHTTGKISETVSATIRDSQLDGGTYCVYLDEFIENLTAALNAIPEEFRESATVTMECYGQYANANLEIAYSVDEPKEESDKRLAKKRAAEAIAKRRKIKLAAQHEKAEYERLKAKFENATVALGEKRK